MKTCYFCRGAIESAVTDYMAHDAAGYLLVKNLTVERCTQCHEVYLGPEAARAVESARLKRSELTESVSIPVATAG